MSKYCYDTNTNQRGFMTQFSVQNSVLTDEEWNELQALRTAINTNPASVHYDKMERFSELMVRTLQGKGDPSF